MKIKLDKGAQLPVRKHPTDAGLDLSSPSRVTVPAHGFSFIDTGIHIELPHGTVGMIKSRSGLNSNGLQCEGVIDEQYTGSIGIVLYNHSSYDYIVEYGERIAQLVIQQVPVVRLEEVDELDATDRGVGGFGSSGV